MKPRQALAVAMAVLSAGAAAGAAVFIALYPPPGTAAFVLPAANPYTRDGAFSGPACGGAQCRLCPYECFLPEGARGRCRVRGNYGGKIRTLCYSLPAAVHLDPIEKKPVYHMYPGSLVYSVSAPGCNLSCRACQNWEISQIYPEQAAHSAQVPAALRLRALPEGRAAGELEAAELSSLPPEDIVRYALATRSRSVAYTYSEPVVFYEYMLDTARLARAAGLKNVMVTSGYINREPLDALLPYMDVVKVDLKGFDEDFYRRYTGARLEPVKATLLRLREKRAMFEVVNLVVPGLNDSPASLGALSSWVKDGLGPDTPLFFTRFTPNYLLPGLPPTPEAVLTAARDSAMKKGLRYVYVGNVPGHPGESTYCPRCGRALVRRYGYAILEDRLTPTGGLCPWDGTPVPGIWR